MIHLYCGDGKGKTTAAIGLSIRAAGRGLKVLFLQFLKSMQTGELHVLSGVEGITILRGDENCTFTFKMDEEKRRKCFASHMEIFQQAMEACENGIVDLLVLDEAVGAYQHDLIEKEKLINFLLNKPLGLEVVMTGRNPAEELMALSDYITEMKKIKHPFDKGISARIGIEK